MFGPALPKNDLFVNYVFEDIGKSFISHLEGALHRNGFTISDHTKLPGGQEVCSELLKAIQESHIYVLVFSINYGFSVRCLDELVNIMDFFVKFDRKKVLPVFFNVDPSHVRNQEGPFKEAFQAHTNNFDHQRVQKWRKALEDAGQLSGQHYENGDEGSFICKIVKKLQKMQNPQELYVTDHPVGIESRVEELISSLRLDLEDFSIVAVLGISGIGKTTIAAAMYNRIAAKFDASCFLGGIRYYDCGSPTSKVLLQKELISCLSQNDEFRMIYSHNVGVTKIRKLISRQKVLLVLDDVDGFDQLEALGINPKFFQGGSRIIVTTRDKQSLGSLSYVSYNTSLLNTTESSELFTRLTYKKDEPNDTHFVNEIALCASGLPLVLEVWSRHFRNHAREQWPNVLKTLKEIPHDDVQKKLQISYDSLTNRAKKLFLDIACFFDGMDKELVVKVLQDEDSAFFPDLEIQCLADKGLVLLHDEISFGLNSRVLMHHAIREMGQEIVRQENEDEPGHRTRLMNRKDVLHVLTEFSGTRSVESIRQGYMTVQIEAFRKMKNLRLIRLKAVTLRSVEGMPPLSFQKLKYLEWFMFPLRSINIDMCNVVVVRLKNSALETLWEGIKRLKKLKILDVGDSRSLIKTGNFSGLKNLEHLHFNGCWNLEELHSSVWCLDKLVILDLNGCKRLDRSPLEMKFKLQSIQVLDLTDCASIGFEYDEVIEHFLSSLKESQITRLMLAHCNIYKVPSEVGSLTGLDHLDLSRNNFHSLPDSLGKLNQLETIDLSYCYSLQSIPYLPHSIRSVKAYNCQCLTTFPSNMSELTSLKELRLDGCSKLGIVDPECLMKLTGLTSLTILTMKNCNVSQVPSEIGNLVSLRSLHLSENTFSSLPDSFGNLLQLRHLWIRDCPNLTSLPLLPPSLTKIEASRCWNLNVMPFASMLTTDFCGSPTSVYNTTCAYKFSKYVLAMYTEASFISRLQINLSEYEVPNWCHYQNTGDMLSFMAPQHFDTKICGMILCASARRRYPLDTELKNMTKGTSYHLTRINFIHSSMCVRFFPLDNTTLMVEAGDNLVLQGNAYAISGFGLCLIYKGDEMEPTTNHVSRTTQFNDIPHGPDDEVYDLLIEEYEYDVHGYATCSSSWGNEVDDFDSDEGNEVDDSVSDEENGTDDSDLDDSNDDSD